MDNIIELRNVYKIFNVYIDKKQSLKEKIIFHHENQHIKRTVLDDISLNIKRGESIGLIGRNGCGKSTLLKIISRIMYPEKGSVEVKGRVSSLIELGAGFHPDMSGRENIFTNASILGLSRKQTEERIGKIIEFSELGEFIDNPIRTYSSGMYMRLAFAVAINVDADILLIDEILSVGDVSFQKKCFEKLKEIKKTGTTIVIVSHSLPQIEKLCEKTYWIESGKIVSEGNPLDVHKQYLAYMKENYENSDIINIEEDIEENSDNIKETSGFEVNLKKDKKINKLNNRWGSQEVYIDSVEITDEKGIKKDAFKTGEIMNIKIHYKAEKKIKDAVAGIGIFRDDGVNCYGTNTFIDKLKELTFSKKGGDIVCTLENNLLEGEYSLDVALHMPDGFAYDYYRGITKFKMYTDINDVGVARIKHEWKF